VMISVTITDRSGRTLSGQTVDAFWVSIAHAKPFSVGVNCALGAKEMRPYVAELARLADCYVSCHPNAGLPNAFGEYDEQPHDTAAELGEFARAGLLNIVGGCCGTTPAHIEAIAAAVEHMPPRRVQAHHGGRGGQEVHDLTPDSSEARYTSGLEDRAGQDSTSASSASSVVERFTQFAGLETLTIRPDSTFQMIGERTNVTGSARFARLIRSGNYAEAAQVALDQVRGGANLIDVNMDEGMLDSERAMTEFLNY